MRENMSFGPKRLGKMERALEEAYAEIRNRIPEALQEGTKQEMAVAVMNAAKAGQTKFKDLKAAAIGSAKLSESRYTDSHCTRV
jgi:hypothetical protein